MATTAAAYAEVAKEVFDSSTLHKMFYDEFPFLDRLEKLQRVIIGKKAHVPLHEQRAGGASVFGAGGGTLNTASNEDVGVAKYNLAYTWFPVNIEFGALNEITGGMQSVGEAQDNMISGALNNVRNQVERQVLTGHGRIAQCAAASNTTTILLSTTPDAGEVSGVDAIMNGWLVPDDQIVIGTAADADSAVTSATGVVSVTDSLTAPAIVLGAAATSTASEFVSLSSNESSTGASSAGNLESDGLVTIAGTSSNTVGEIDGSSVGHWNPAEADVTSTLVDMDLLLRLKRRVLRRTGQNYTYCLTSLKQLDNIYSMLQAQSRFVGDKELGAGGSATTKWNNMEIHAFPHVPENFLFMLTLEDLELVFGAYDKPTWASEVEGSNRGHIWGGNTSFDDAIVYAVGLAARRRNSHAAATKLTA